MNDYESLIDNLKEEVRKLHHRQELSKTVGPDYYEPGLMEYLDQSDGSFDPSNGELMLRFEVKGTRYEGRTELIEKIHVGDSFEVCREKDNAFNPNNFFLTDKKGRNLGNMPAELCNALAPFYDAEILIIESCKVSYVEPISKRNRHAKQAMLFVELKANLQEAPVPDEEEIASFPC